MRRLILINVIAVLTGLLAGYLINSQVAKPATVSPESIPLPANFLSSQVVTDLYANAEGVVIAKTEDSLTIKKGSDTLILSVKESMGLTTFFEKTPQGIKPIKFQDIKAGDNIKGGISIVLQSTPTRKKDEIIAHALTVTHK